MIMKLKRFLRSAAACILSASLFSQTAMGAQTINPEEILGNIADQVNQAVEKLDIPAFEGGVHVEALDGMRGAIADHYRSEDDMSWIESADLLVKGCENELDGLDVEAALAFNETELYHLQASFDRQENTLYLISPELKKEVIAFPIGDFTADAQAITGKKISPQMMAEGISLLQELNTLISSISLEMLQEEVMKYYTELGSRIQMETGFTTVQAGTLTSEGSTVVFSVTGEQLVELIPKALEMLSQDEFLKGILTSEFGDHVFNLAMRSTFSDIQFPAGALWSMVQQTLMNASEKDYSGLYGGSVTVALDKKNRPLQLSVMLEKSGMKVDLVQINAIAAGSDHAFEVKIGPMLAEKIGIKSNMSTGFILQGSLKDDYLRESVSLHWNGATTPVFRIQDCDLLKIGKDVWLNGVATLILNGIEYSCDFFRDEDGLRTMVYSVKGEDWFKLTAELNEVESTSLDDMDTEDAFVVDSRQAFEAYMRDASALNMFEKLSSAGVPQEYVDMLTDGEAATESSRENTVELNQ